MGDRYMKIFNTKEIKAIESDTVKNEQISHIELMERAALSVAYEIMSHWRPDRRFVMFAGPGNNGGVALAVSRILTQQGYSRIEVFFFNVPSSRLSECCRINRDRLCSVEGIDYTEVVSGEFDPPALGRDDIIIDGLFGSGLLEPLKGGFTSLVQYINESKSAGAYIVALDTPSGLLGEYNMGDRRNIIKANVTYAFQFKRLSFFFAENAENVGECKVLDVGLSQDTIRTMHSNCYLVEDYEVKDVLRHRTLHCNKYDFGNLLLVAGSYGMYGAAILAARAAMRSGVGLMSVHAPCSGLEILQISVPEAKFDADQNDFVTTDVALKHDYQAVALGPGIGTDEKTCDALEKFLKNYRKPCVLDADALNCIYKRPTMLDFIPPKSVITPHAMEFDRIFGTHHSEEERLRRALEVAKKYQIVIVLKAHHTITVSDKGRVYVNSNGNPGMATAGSGDVLTGIIAALLAQGYDSRTSAVLGVFIHGAAGDMAAQSHGVYGMVSGDIVENIGQVIRNLTR